MPVSVRFAHPVDADTIINLNEDVQRLHADLEPCFFKADTDRSALREFFAAKLEMAEHHFWIACAGEDEGPSGYVWLEVQDRPETPLNWARRHIYIHHLSVRAAARRRGIASALIRQVEMETRDEGRNHGAGRVGSKRSCTRFLQGSGFYDVQFFILEANSLSGFQVKPDAGTLGAQGVPPLGHPSA